MARARTGLAELGPDLMSVYLSLLAAIAETLAGNPAAAERAVRDAAAMVAGSTDRWHQAMVGVDLAHAVIAQGRDAAAAVASIEDAPAPCDLEWVVKRRTAPPWVAATSGDLRAGVEEARAAVTAIAGSGLILVKADAHAMLARVLALAGEPTAAADAAACAAEPTRRRATSSRPARWLSR